jgi:hypothetical protein
MMLPVHNNKFIFWKRKSNHINNASSRTKFWCSQGGLMSRPFEIQHELFTPWMQAMHEHIRKGFLAAFSSYTF